MMRIALALVLAVTLFDASAQSFRRADRDRGERQMSREDRQRMREDMRDAYRGRQDRPQERPRQLSPEQRDKLRQDIQDANRNLKR